jgi:hypothetical protein
VPSITRLVGVYDADGTMLGELTYVVRRQLGRDHCALCDITHGRLRERADWRTCRVSLRVPFVTFHRDDQPSKVRTATGAVAPIVVAELDDGSSVVLATPEDLRRCDGSPDALVDHLRAEAARRGLDLGAA